MMMAILGDSVLPLYQYMMWLLLLLLYAWHLWQHNKTLDSANYMVVSLVPEYWDAICLRLAKCNDPYTQSACTNLSALISASIKGIDDILLPSHDCVWIEIWIHVKKVSLLNYCDRLRCMYVYYKVLYKDCRFHSRARGPTLSEISYALAEITEIKFEIAKSSSLKRNHKLVLKSEISPQYTRFP